MRKLYISLYMVIYLMIPFAYSANYGENNYGCGLYGVGCREEVKEEPAGSSGGSAGARGGGCDVFADYFEVCYYINESGECSVGCYEGYYCDEDYRCKELKETLLEKRKDGKKAVIIGLSVLSIILLGIISEEEIKKRKKRKKKVEKIIEESGKLAKILLILFLFTVFSSILVMSERQPFVDGDYDRWGTIINGFLNVSHTENGSLRADLNVTFYNFNVTNDLNVIGNSYFNGTLMPLTSLTFDIGSGANRWRNIYGTNFSIDNIDITGSALIDGDLNVTGTSYLSGFTIADDLIVGNINISGSSTKIGIGTLTPTSELHVIGNANISSSEIQVYTLGGVLYVMGTE